VPLGDLGDQREAEPVPAPPLRTLAEGGEPVEHPGQHLWCDTRPVIADRKLDHPAGGGDRDAHCGLRVLQGVVEQRGDRPAQGGGRAGHRDRARRGGPVQRNALGSRSGGGHRIVHNGHKVHGLGCRGSRIGGDQQVLHDPVEMPGVPDQAFGIRATRPPMQQLRPGAEQRQRGAQLVAGVGDEPALQRERLGQRAHGSPTEPEPDRRGEPEAGDTHRQQHTDQPHLRHPVGMQVQHRLDHLAVYRLGAHPVVAAGGLHLVKLRGTGPPDPVQRAAIGQPGRHARGALLVGPLPDRQPHAGRRVAHVVGLGHGVGQQPVRHAALPGQHHQRGHPGQQHHDQRHDRRRLHAQPERRAAHDLRVRAGSHPLPSR
jgi:hypothetical protein